jgi:hypothetical protein
MALFDGFRRKTEQTRNEGADDQPQELEQDADSLDESATRFRAAYLNVATAGDDVLLHDPEWSAPEVLPAFELDLLTQCTRFAPVEEHATAVAQRTGLPADGIVSRLYELVDRGLLISKRDVIEGARAAAQAGDQAEVHLDRIGVITSNRPESLERCLSSYRERYGADVELVVFDDSADSATRDENRRVATRAGAGGRTLYAGPDEKRRFIAELATKSGVESDLVTSAFTEFDGCSFHGGANRNTALLDASGGAVLLVDDDTTARTVFPASADGGLRLSSQFDPLSLRFFASVADALDQADWSDVDILAWHRRFLGRSPAECAFVANVSGADLPLDEQGSAVDLDEADAALVAAFSRGRGRVIATTTSVVGESGMGSTPYFLLLQGAARDRVLENYELYRATSGVQRGADVPTISNSHFFMASHAAFDVRTIVPPFSPVLRAEDAAFGAILRMCAPESYIAFLPFSVEHAPPAGRSASFEQVIRTVVRVGANEIIRDLALSHDLLPGVTDASRRLQAFGQYLSSLSAMTSADFDAFVRFQIMTSLGRRLDAFTRTVDLHGGQPEDWANDCAEAVAAGMRALTDAPVVVADIPAADAEDSFRKFQRLIGRFGRLLAAWPALLEAAADLRAAEPLRS